MQTENQGTFFKRLFFPLVLFLGLMGSSSSLTYIIASRLEIAILQIHQSFPKVFSHWEVVSIVFFSIFLFLLRKTEFKRIFKIGLPLAFVIVLLSVFLIPSWEISIFITRAVSQVLFLLGWAYVNQVVLLPQAKKYYFALNFLMGVFMALLINIPLGIFYEKFSISFCFFFLTVCLGLAFLCHLWLQKRKPFPTTKINPIKFSEKWHAVFYLSFIYAGYKLINYFYYLLFKQYIKPFEVSSYSSSMNQFSNMRGIYVLLTSFLLVFLGPYLIRKKGWKFLVFLSSFILGVYFVSYFFIPLNIYLPLGPVVAMSLGSSLLIPLTHIAFLSYSATDRFLIQTWVFLVASPLIQWLGKQIYTLWILPEKMGQNLAVMETILLSYLVLALMVFAAIRIAKKRENLTEH